MMVVLAMPTFIHRDGNRTTGNGKVLLHQASCKDNLGIFTTKVGRLFHPLQLK